MSSEFLLGVDVGTYSTKGVLASPDGRIVRQHEVTHELLVPRPGWAEHDAENAWWGDFLAVCRELLAGGAGKDVRAVGVSGIGPCFCPADEDGKALRPAILYGVDTRAAAEIDELDRRLGREAILARTGSVLTSQAVGPKLLWFRKNEAELFARTHYLLPASSLLIHRLTGEYAIDRHTASGFNPLFEVNEDRWIGEWVEEVLGSRGPPLPRLLWAVDTAGEINADAAAVTGLRAGTPVSAGTVDAAAEAFSVGVRKPGDLMLMYGSTMFLIAIVEHLGPDARLWGTRYLLPGSANLAAGTATSGSLTAWLRDLVGSGDRRPSFEELVEEAASVAPGSDGLVVLPYFSGERTPIYDPSARGLVAGLSLRHGRGHLYRALLEATAYAVRHILETLNDAAARVERAVAVGGGVRGGLWPQILSDVTGLPQEISAVTVGASYGNSLLAGIAAGIVPPATRWDRRERTVWPDEEVASLYDKYYAVYRDIYPATRPCLHALADLARASAIRKPASG